MNLISFFLSFLDDSFTDHYLHLFIIIIIIIIIYGK